MPRRNWKYVAGHDPVDALDKCLQHAKEKHNLSVERIMDRLGMASKSQMYGYLADAKLPVNRLIAFEQTCGIPLFTKYSAASQGFMLVKIPTGRKAEAKELAELQVALAQVGSQIISFYNGECSVDETTNMIMAALQDLAYHKSELEHFNQPSLLGDHNG